MTLMRRMLNQASSPSSSPLHLDSYELPVSSRLPKFMIAAVAGFIVLITAAYYFCKWWFFRKCADDNRDSSNSPGAEESPANPAQDELNLANKRLGAKIAMAIPAIEYSKLQEVRSEVMKCKVDAKDLDLEADEACAICLVELSRSPATPIKVLPRCGHAFHGKCIDLWLCTSHASCPICRASLFAALSSRVAPPRDCSSPSNQSPRESLSLPSSQSPRGDSAV